MTRTPNLVAILGADIAGKLSILVGGRRLCIPRDLSRAGTLSRDVGPEIAALLIFHFGGQGSVYIPNGNDRGGAPKVDPKKVARLSKKGWSAARIASHLGCTDRAIYRSRKLNREKHARKSTQ